jgi:hypothetical protein
MRNQRRFPSRISWLSKTNGAEAEYNLARTLPLQTFGMSWVQPFDYY